MIKPGSPEWHARKKAMLEQERSQPIDWWWVSFADPTRPPPNFLGGCLVLAQGPITALQRTHDLGISPGGEARMSCMVVEGQLPVGSTDRLLSLEEMDWLFGGSERY